MGYGSERVPEVEPGDTDLLPPAVPRLIDALQHQDIVFQTTFAHFASQPARFAVYVM